MDEPRHPARLAHPRTEQEVLSGWDARQPNEKDPGCRRSLKNSRLFCELLDVLVAAYSKALTIHVILDNYGIHASRLVKQNLVSFDGKIALHFLPSYCPDHNRIEREWQELHANVTRNHRCKYLLTLLMYAYLYLAHRNQTAAVKSSLRTRFTIAA